METPYPSMDELLANGGKLLVTMALREMEYSDYLRTSHWASVRKNALDRAENRCICGEWARDIHHISYANRGCEQEGDVIAMCRDCHDRFHATWSHRIRAELATL